MPAVIATALTRVFVGAGPMKRAGAWARFERVAQSAKFFGGQPRTAVAPEAAVSPGAATAPPLQVAPPAPPAALAPALPAGSGATLPPRKKREGR